jgi:hypothetical protein
MTAEDQVCNPELAKKLRMLGVEQRSIWYWCEHMEASEAHHTVYELEWGAAPFPCAAEHDKISAFTVADLGGILPKVIRCEEPRYLTITNHASPFDRRSIWYVYYERAEEAPDCKYGVEAASEADARAKMLIHLLENELV